MEERLSKIRKFHKRFRQLFNESRRLAEQVVVAEPQQREAAATISASLPTVAAQRPAMNTKYGRFQLAERWNVDQVPFALLNGQGSTLAERDSKRIVISQTFPGLKKRR